MFNDVETKECFKGSLTSKYFKYLETRGINNKQYIDSLRQKQFGLLIENMFMVEDSPYCVQCILGRSDENIYDIIKTNELYDLAQEEGTVVAVMYGDDYVFLKPEDEKVYFMNHDEGKTIIVANTYNEFVSKIKILED